MTRICGLATATPDHKISSAELVEVLAMGDSARTRELQALAKGSGVLWRHSLLPARELMAEASGPLAKTEAIRLATVAARRALAGSQVSPEEVRVLISASSTWLDVPSIDAHIAGELGLAPRCRRIPLSQLGCAGGMSALAIADSLDVKGPVLIVAAEFPSVHLARGEVSVGDATSALTFGDAVAAFVVQENPLDAQASVLATRSVLLPNTVELTGARFCAGGLRAFDSRKVLPVVRREIESIVMRFLEDEAVATSDVRFWTLPCRGGVLTDLIRDALHLTDEDVAATMRTWANHGGTVSAAAFLCLDAQLRNPSVRAGNLGVMISLGAGTTCELALVRAEAAFDN